MFSFFELFVLSYFLKTYCFLLCIPCSCHSSPIQSFAFFQRQLSRETIVFLCLVASNEFSCDSNYSLVDRPPPLFRHSVWTRRNRYLRPLRRWLRLSSPGIFNYFLFILADLLLPCSSVISLRAIRGSTNFTNPINCIRKITNIICRTLHHIQDRMLYNGKHMTLYI